MSWQPWGMRAHSSHGLVRIPPILDSPTVLEVHSQPLAHIDTILLFEGETIPTRGMRKTEAQRRRVTQLSGNGITRGGSGFKPSCPNASILLASSLALH